jgi:hypothetical protein
MLPGSLLESRSGSVFVSAEEYELVRIHETTPQLDLAGVAPANFENWKNNNHVFSHGAVFW